MNPCDLAYISLQEDGSLNKNGDLGAHGEVKLFDER